MAYVFMVETVADTKPLHSVAICLYLTKSKRRNNDEIIYKFNRGYEFTSHFTMCVQSAPDDIQCSMAMQQISIGKKWPGAHTIVE